MTTHFEDPQFKSFISAFTTLAKSNSVEENRRNSKSFFLSQNTIYEPVEKKEDKVIKGRSGHSIPLRIYTPTLSKNLPILIYLHRGGWVFGSNEESEPVCRKLANHLHCVVVAVEYRLAPEFPFPLPLEDCYDALTWVSTTSDLLGNKDKIIACGESAGGNLATSLALLSRDLKGPKLWRQLLLYPIITSSIEDSAYTSCHDQFFLTKEAMEYFWNAYLQDPKDRDNCYASPDRASDFSGLPPALIITAEHDPLKHEAERYAQKLRQSNVPVILEMIPDVIHGFIDLPIYKEKEKVLWIEKIKNLLFNPYLSDL